MATLVRRRLKQKTTLADDRARTAAAVTAAAASAAAAAAHAASTEALAAAQNHADGVHRRLRGYAKEEDKHDLLWRCVSTKAPTRVRPAPQGQGCIYVAGTFNRRLCMWRLLALADADSHKSVSERQKNIRLTRTNTSKEATRKRTVEHACSCAP
jgi:hypothetical protein